MPGNLDYFQFFIPYFWPNFMYEPNPFTILLLTFLMAITSISPFGRLSKEPESLANGEIRQKPKINAWMITAWSKAWWNNTPNISQKLKTRTHWGSDYLYADRQKRFQCADVYRSFLQRGFYQIFLSCFYSKNARCPSCITKTTWDKTPGPEQEQQRLLVQTIAAKHLFTTIQTVWMEGQQLGSMLKRSFLSVIMTHSTAFTNLGQEYINDRLHEMGYPTIQINHRLEVSMTQDENRHTNP